VIGGRFYVERSHNEITQMFKEFDKDGNGSLSQNEILEGMKMFRGNFSKRQVLDLIRKVDKNTDNSISINGKYE
jgi:Ca2+-binding EF-hand superfamily protein